MQDPANTERTDNALPAGRTASDKASNAAADDAPKIYVACLASYNAGILHGRWINVTDTDEIGGEVRAMLAESPELGAEEWLIHDYEGFEGAEISEYASFETVCALAEFISEHGRLGGKLLGHCGQDLDEARTAFENYAGEHKSLVDFAEELTDQSGTEIPQSLAPYIDYEAMGRDLELGGDVFMVETGYEEIHVFWSR